ncbi:MAG: superkiller protein 3 [Parcubacteria group bacterium LiPW_30]|nr:MAG: superkiller protein 3 [Parcubacteria group bacterium LiPW_30]
MNKLKIKTIFLLTCFALLLSIISLFVFRTSVASTIWNNFHIEAVATLLNQNDAELFFNIGNYYFGEGAYDLSKSEKYYRKALAVDSALERLHYQIARLHFINNNLYEARSEINKELELYPDFRRSYYVRGLINGYDNKLEEAESDFVEFLEWKKDSWAGYNDLAWVYFRMGDYKKVLATADSGLKYYPDSVWLLNSKGVALLNLGQKREAKDVLVKALFIAENMDVNEWGVAYPGNNPEIYSDGLRAMRESIKRNLELIDGVES